MEGVVAERGGLGGAGRGGRGGRYSEGGAGGGSWWAGLGGGGGAAWGFPCWGCVRHALREMWRGGWWYHARGQSARRFVRFCSPSWATRNRRPRREIAMVGGARWLRPRASMSRADSTRITVTPSGASRSTGPEISVTSAPAARAAARCHIPVAGRAVCDVAHVSIGLVGRPCRDQHCARPPAGRRDQAAKFGGCCDFKRIRHPPHSGFARFRHPPAIGPRPDDAIASKLARHWRRSRRCLHISAGSGRRSKDRPLGREHSGNWQSSACPCAILAISRRRGRHHDAGAVTCRRRWAGIELTLGSNKSV